VELYLNSPIRLHAVVLSLKKDRDTISFTFFQTCHWRMLFYFIIISSTNITAVRMSEAEATLAPLTVLS
jgi:hypothetical protein